ncbi:MAG: hypothetical protein AAGD09_13690 [Cyanobacteria bacterium P01_F01_bin.56]
MLYLLSGVLLRDRLKLSQSRRYWIGGFVAMLLLCRFLTIGFMPESAI